MSIGNRIILLFVMCLGSCSSIPEEKVLDPNPTSYIYNCSADTLKNAIDRQLQKMQFRDMMLYSPTSAIPPADTATIFLQKGNQNDFYLSTSFLWIGESFQYPGKKYSASFHLHLVPVSESQTEVVIVTVTPKIIIGKKNLPSWPHFSRDYKYLPVSPTTIEEYEILYRIGKGLGQSMPEIRYPKN